MRAGPSGARVGAPVGRSVAEGLKEVGYERAKVIFRDARVLMHGGPNQRDDSAVDCGVRNRRLNWIT